MLAVCCSVLPFCYGCVKQPDETKWGASCRIYVENLPQEYNDLPAEIRENTTFYLSVSNPSADKHYSIKLTEDNGYSEVTDLLPGTYTVSHVTVSNHLLEPISAVSQTQSLTIEQGTASALPVFLSNPEGLTQLIQQNKAAEAILNEGIYSRKVQYAGSVYDMQELSEIMDFTSQEESHISYGDIAYRPSKSHIGVSMIVQNTNDSGSLPISQCQLIGFRFSNSSAVLPKGLTVGLPAEKIAHAKTGLLGTPNYCLGTPLIGMGIDQSTFVYLDKDSGDRISIEIDSSKGYVRTITYEFQRYQ